MKTKNLFSTLLSRLHPNLALLATFASVEASASCEVFIESVATANSEDKPYFLSPVSPAFQKRGYKVSSDANAPHQFSLQQTSVDGSFTKYQVIVNLKSGEKEFTETASREALWDIISESRLKRGYTKTSEKAMSRLIALIPRCSE